MNIITDVLIIGAGVAGLYTALNLDEKLKVIMVSKGEVNECNSNWAQGGISVARGYDDVELFVQDTLKAGQYKNDINAVKVLAEESIENINALIELGVDFDRSGDELNYTREGAHTINRIVHYKDKTGNRVEEVLLNNVRDRRNIKFNQNCCLVDILKKDNLCMGGICIKDNKQINIYSKVTILATGGIGGVFKNSTNERIITGDGIAIGIKNNIKVKNINYIQFHPTVFYSENNNNERRFLISESVRGEGGKLINNKGERFVDELLPRNVVSKFIIEEEKKTNSNNVYLDVSFMPKDFLQKRFPTIYEECLKYGIDISKQPIPVTPAQHYFMGGLEVDLYGKTSMENLYAFGEVSCTGVHGANRLASNSLLEALVFSKRGAENINKSINDIEIIYSEVCELDHNSEYYQEMNKKILVDTIAKLRGDIKNELVTCG